MSTSTSEAALYSSLGDDPDLAEIVEMFVDEMSERIEKFEQLLEATDWESLRRAGHQLKGAAGSYGFDQLTSYAARVEAASQEGQDDLEEIKAAVEELVEMCRRVRPGAAE